MPRKYIKFVVQCLDENGDQVVVAASPTISHRGKLTPIELEVYRAEKAGEFVIAEIIELPKETNATD